jgi:two-component system cell cycle sensor histidine kinase/response regulator CckA
MEGSSRGYNVITAENGQVALDILRHNGHHLDLVLLDMTMPVMSGEETLKRIKELRPDLPVVGMSGFSEVEAVRRFGDRLDRFVQKPFFGARLMQVIGDGVERRGNGKGQPAPGDVVD